jgi:hypothetical protein
MVSLSASVLLDEYDMTPVGEFPKANLAGMVVGPIGPTMMKYKRKVRVPPIDPISPSSPESKQCDAVRMCASVGCDAADHCFTQAKAAYVACNPAVRLQRGFLLYDGRFVSCMVLLLRVRHAHTGRHPRAARAQLRRLPVVVAARPPSRRCVRACRHVSAPLRFCVLARDSRLVWWGIVPPIPHRPVS